MPYCVLISALTLRDMTITELPSLETDWDIFDHDDGVTEVLISHAFGRNYNLIFIGKNEKS